MLSLIIKALTLSATIVFSQTTGIGKFELGNFLGLNDTDAAATVLDQECTNCLNVESSISGTSLLKRKGYSREASLTYTTSAVTGSFLYRVDAGDEIRIVCHDVICAKSTNGSQYTNFLTTATSIPTRWSIVAVDGDAYLANDKRDKIALYDGATLTYSSNVPQGSILELINGRLAVADTSGNPGRVSYSKEGDFVNFTTGVNDVDSFTDDLGSPGDRATGLKTCNGLLYIFKFNSITACDVDNQYTTKCQDLTDVIGTDDPETIICGPDGLYFESSDKGYWRFSNGSFTLLSRKISNLTKAKVSGKNRSNTQTTKADWEAGTEISSDSWDTVTRNGSIFPSSTTFVDTSSGDFNSGTIQSLSSTDTFGSLKMSSTTYKDYFADAEHTSNLAWTATAGTFQVNATRGLVAIRYTSPYTSTIETSEAAITSGSWRFRYYYTNGGAVDDCQGLASICFDFNFQINAGGDSYIVRVLNNSGATKTLRIVKSVGGTETILTNTTAALSESTDYDFEVDKTTDGRIYLYLDSVYKSSTTDLAITSATKTGAIIAATQYCCGLGTLDNFLGRMDWLQYKSSGNFISRIFDTTYSTGIFASLSSTFTIPMNDSASGNVAFYVKSTSSPNNDLWNNWLSSSDTIRISTAAKRYVQYRIDFTNLASTLTPRVDVVSMQLATTGQYVTQCIQPSVNISSWGIISCAENIVGNGSLVYYATSAATCATLPASPPNAWQFSVTNNQTVSISTNVALYIGIRSLLGAATDQSQVDACTIYWSEGSVAKPNWGVYDPINNWIYWTATTGTATSQNRLLKYDLNMQTFWPFGLNVSALLFRSGAVEFGSANGGYWNKYGSVDADNGSNIQAYWRSKDFSPGDVFQEKSFDRLSVVAKNQQNGSISVTGSWGRGTSTSYTVSTSTSSSIPYIRSNYGLPLSSPHTFFGVQIDNNSAFPFEILGIRLDFSLKEWRVLNP